MLLPFEWFVAMRYMRDARGQTGLILGAVSVGVAVVVFLSALINGLQASLIAKTLGSQPHITIETVREAPRPLVYATDALAISRTVQASAQRLRSIDQWPVVLSQAEQVPGVVAASAVVSGAGFAVRGEAKLPIVLNGVEPDRYLSIIDVKSKLVEGRFELAGGQVAIGSVLASDLGVSVGDKIRVNTAEGLSDTVTVAGIFTLGNRALDQTWIFTSLRHAQALFALPGGATAIELKVLDVFRANAIADDVRARTNLRVESWMQRNSELLSGLSAQASSKSMIQFFVIVAVALGIASVLIVSVVQKSREIGILRAVGTSSRRVLAIFLIQGGVLGLIGSFIGSAMGAALALFFESLTIDASGAPRFGVELNASLFLQASAIAIVVGLLAAVVPARNAAKLDPATAIRNG